MTVRQRLESLLERLSDDRLGEVLEFAQSLANRIEHQEWQAFGRGQLAAAYGPDEPEYTLNDIKRRGTT